MNNVLITGAAGFIGSHLCEKFIREDFEVYGIDNFVSGNLKNLDKLKDFDNFHFKKHDVIDDLNLGIEFDLILHFACPASPEDFLNFPLETLKANSIGTFKTIELAESMGSRYVFASTSEIYGDPLIHPQNENYWGNVNPIGSRSVYNEAKRFSEAVTIAYYQKKSVDVRIPRIFNTYGPNMRVNDGRIIPNFIIQALNEESLTVYGNGSQTRSLCYIDDLVKGIFMMSMNDNISGEILNIGNPEEYTVIDIARNIIKRTGSNSDIIFKNLPEDDPKRRCPDITKAEKFLNYSPRIMLDQGLDHTIEFFRSKLFD
jgi:nucleoside-diphosphate-sugar epimerase